MAFKLQDIVPWGRSFLEYQEMFSLTQADLNKQIISFGDGPASFNAVMARQGKRVISIDPVYQYTKEDLEKRISVTTELVIEQTKKNLKNFVWNRIKNTEELKDIRLNAMNEFLKDFMKGKADGRYVNHALPQKTSFHALSFDLALSSHFLILYEKLGLEFHKAAIKEMLRVAKEVRIFPLLNLDARKPELLLEIINFFETDYFVEIKKTSYEFQRHGNQMLVIKHN